MHMADFNDSDVSGKLGQLRKEAEERETERVAASLGLPYLNLGLVTLELEALKLVEEAEAREAQLAVVKAKQKELAIAVRDPKDQKTTQSLKKLEGKGFKNTLYIVSAGSLQRVWEHYKEIVPMAQEITSEVNITKDAFNSIKSRVANLSEAESLFKNLLSPKSAAISTSEIMAYVFGSSIAIDASDIHFETDASSAHMRFRIDGLLHEVAVLPLNIYKQILNRVKLLSGLKINVSDIPQDGRFTIKFDLEEIEIRVAVSPSEFGEAIVMRVLNPKAISITLSELGLRKDNEDIANEEIKRPNGMVLVTGPTGCGKTTTLYAFLRAVTNPELKIITIEDPIEYHLKGVEQTQVDTKSGYTFASGLRSMLRQDPDMILVGEIRDFETAEIAVHASLTGHLVFSTLHTNNAVGAVPRLIDIGIKPSILGSALTLVIAQRLVRRLCLNCRKETEAPSEIKTKINSFLKKLPSKVAPYSDKISLFKPVGCSLCNNGYKGRVGIHEFLKTGEGLSGLIDKDISETAIRNFALKNGLVEMQADGILKAIAGITTLEEVEAATGQLKF